MPLFVPKVSSKAGRYARWGLVPFCLFGVLLAGVHLYLNSDAVTLRIQGKLERELEGRGIGFRLGAVEVDWLGRVTLRGFELPAGAGGPALLKAEAIRIRPSYHAMLDGRLQAASVRLEEVELNPGQSGQGVRDFLLALKSRPARPASSAEAVRGQFPLLRVSHGVVHLAPGTLLPQGLQIGPLDGEVALHREAGHRELEAQLALTSGGSVRAVAQWGDSEPMVLELMGKGIQAAVIPLALWERLPVHVEGGEARFKVRAEALPNLRTGALTFDVRGEDMVLSGERLSSERVGPWEVGAHGTVRWDRSRRKFRLDDAALTIGAKDELKVGLGLEAGWAAPFNFRLDAHIDKMPYQAALDALPYQVTPGPTAPQLDGPLSAQVMLQGPLRQPDAWEVTVNLDLSRLKETAKGTPSKLKGQFLYEPRDVSGPTHEVWVGDKNPLFIPLSQLPPYVFRAVTASEDAGFFAHHGFDFQEMKNTFVSVAEEKRFRGASTITQQLAKNLFLSRERTYARKLQEALITLALEASLSKQRLLEIYLNIIEWGPGVFGIGEAAQHYFGKDARALTVKEAAFLATIIPNPIRYHVYFTKGELSDTWQNRLHELIGRMHEQGVLTDLEYMQAVAAPLTFKTSEGRRTVMTGSRRAERTPEPWVPLHVPTLPDP
jgi:monofunctional biosynthetic peptidoglycan transglycosylase